MKTNKRQFQIELEVTSYLNHAFDDEPENRAKPLEVTVKKETATEWFSGGEEAVRAFYADKNDPKFDVTKHWCGHEYKILSIREVSAPFFYKVGDGITEAGYSDCYSHTVVAVSKNGKVLTVARDHCKQTEKLNFTPGGFVGHFDDAAQKWEIVPETDPAKGYLKVSLRKNGRWVSEGSSATGTAGHWFPGRHEHYDYNF